MKNILVIGNGYDLAHGLKTSYKDFMDFVLERKWDSCSIDSLGDDPKQIEQDFIEIVTNNPFVKYFKDYCRDISTWVDFESELRRITKSIYRYLRSFPMGYESEIKLSADYAPNPYEQKVLGYFGYIQKASWGIGSEDVLLIEPRIYSEVYGINWDEVNSDMKKALDALKKGLIIYLKYYMPCVSNTLYEVKQIRQINPDSVISFNYTNTYQLYGIPRSKVKHVHGDIQSEKIVLGYEDDGEDEELYLLGFRKFFQRVENKLPMIGRKAFTWIEEGMVRSTCNIYIYGMSLDKTDEDLIKIIFKGSRKFVVYYLDNGTDYPNKVKNLIMVLGKDVFLKAYEDEKIIFEKIDNK